MFSLFLLLLLMYATAPLRTMNFPVAMLPALETISIMRAIPLLMVLAGLALPLKSAAQTTPQKFLLYCYGADGIDVTTLIHPNDDLWMLRGLKDEGGIEAVKATDLKLGASG